ncbi:MAG: outer membrane lipoprotein-sorting protein [Sporocytophaga sp.]|uniref:outer membrane lipoprotein-sorting protein n=1 Tax=Sporocytophaga sp. TaxID=2231183 RepID=UPI001B035390|nr:outer membrane lipoprotein-sorting protein [Sporocytophaga sp.]MBO9699903.1 outer membrane lipoprotein-sorting protein [Sporocytophaga sp.]
MKSFQIIFVIILSVFSLTALVPASTQDALKIISRVDSVSRESYKTSITKIKLTTCKYEIKGGSLSCSENPRISVLESAQKHYGNETRSIAVVLEPSKDKGIGMLTYENLEAGKDNDTWLYLSAIGKVKRLVSSSEDSDESGSFFGSEFSVEDMSSRKVKDYTYKLIGEETYDNRKVWVIESVPTALRAKKTKYGKITSWIDKERLLVLKEDLYDHRGKLCKQLNRKGVELIDKVWVVRVTTMNNLVSRRVTELRLISVAYNMEASDEFLTQRSLTDFAFREKNLAKFRTYMK